jgi:predicted transcriptional regulator
VLIIAVLQIYIDDELNSDLEIMARELKISKSVIAALSIYSLLGYYNAKSSFALIDISYSNSRKSEKKMKIDIPEEIKEKLKLMSDEQARSMNQMAAGALRTILVEYKVYGFNVFSNLVAPKDQILF